MYQPRRESTASLLGSPFSQHVPSEPQAQSKFREAMYSLMDQFADHLVAVHEECLAESTTWARGLEGELETAKDLLQKFIERSHTQPRRLSKSSLDSAPMVSSDSESGDSMIIPALNPDDDEDLAPAFSSAAPSAPNAPPKPLADDVFTARSKVKSPIEEPEQQQQERPRVYGKAARGHFPGHSGHTEPARKPSLLSNADAGRLQRKQSLLSFADGRRPSTFSQQANGGSRRQSFASVVPHQGADMPGSLSGSLAERDAETEKVTPVQSMEQDETSQDVGTQRDPRMLVQAVSSRHSRVSFQIGQEVQFPQKGAGLMRPHMEDEEGEDMVSKKSRNSLDGIADAQALWMLERLPLHAAWVQLLGQQMASMSSKMSVVSLHSLRSNDDLGQYNTLDEHDHHWSDPFDKYIMDPGSGFRIAWDLVTTLMVVFECVTLPLSFFNIDEYKTMRIASVVLPALWTVDFILSFFTGYFSAQGQVRTRAVNVWRHYLRTWFTVDIALICLDWIDLAGFTAADFGQTLKFVRLLKVFRLVRLSRKVKLPDAVHARLFKSEIQVILLGVVRIMLLLVWLSHLFACCFFGISSGSDSALNWLEAYELMDAPVYNQYAAAVFWSIGLFAGSCDIHPVSSLERAFTAGALYIVYMISATMISSITSSMTRLEIATATEASKLSDLKRYLNEHKISSSISIRVQQNAHFVMQEIRRMKPESEVELLSLISEPLRLELHFEIHMPTISRHAFFLHYEQQNPTLMRQACHQCISQVSFSKGDIAFDAGEVMANPGMIFVESGSFLYTRPQVATAGVQLVRIGQWAAEAVLWTPWTFRGLLRAKTHCSAMILNAETFQETVAKFPNSIQFALNYGKSYLMELAEVPEHDMTDLQMSCIDIDILLLACGVGDDQKRHSNRSSLQSHSSPQKPETTGFGWPFSRVAASLERISEARTSHAERKSEGARGYRP